MLKTGYTGDERAKKSKKGWKGNPEISNNRRKSPYYLKQGGTKGKMVITGAQSLGHPGVVGAIQTVQRDEATEQVELQLAMLPGVERL